MGVLTGIPRDASRGLGGICEVLIANWGDVMGDVSGASIDDATGIVTFAADASTYFKVYQPSNNTANYNVALTGTEANGSNEYLATVTLGFKRNQAAKRNEVAVLANSEVEIVLKDKNGLAWAFGNKCNGMALTGNIGESGTAGGDSMGQTMTFTQSFDRPELIVDDYDALKA